MIIGTSLHIRFTMIRVCFSSVRLLFIFPLLRLRQSSYLIFLSPGLAKRCLPPFIFVRGSVFFPLIKLKTLAIELALLHFRFIR